MLNLIKSAYAATGDEIPKFTFLSYKMDISYVVVKGLQWFVGIIGALAVVYLVYGGVIYITAGSDAEKAGKGRVAIVNAIIGIVIIAAAFLIINWVSKALLTVK